MKDSIYLEEEGELFHLEVQHIQYQGEFLFSFTGLTENEGEEKSVENWENENGKTTEEDKTTMDEVCSGEESQNGRAERD